MTLATSPTPIPRARREARRRMGPLVVSLVVHGLVLAGGWWWSSRVAPVPAADVLVSLSFALRDEPLDVPFDALDDVSVDARPPAPPGLPDERLPDPPVEPPLDALPDVPPERPTSTEPDPAPALDEALPDFASPAPPLSPSSAMRPGATTPTPAIPLPTPTPIAPRPRPPLVEHVAPRPPALAGGASGATYVVTIEYDIAADGRVAEATVTAGSGWPALDEATRAFLLAHWRYAPPGEPRRASRRFLFRYGE